LSFQAPQQIQSDPAAPISAPAENPLDQLRDIHLPDQVDQFPSAPGWWLLLTIILIAIGYFVYRRYQYQKAIRLLKPARAELSELKSLSPDVLGAHSIAALSALLKRICLVYFPQLEVASLSGQNWLKFLNQQKTLSNTEMVFFSPKNIQLFCETPYQKNPNVSANDWDSLISASESCISQIIIGAAKTKIKNNKGRVKS
jgi:hypothetical protein